MKNLIIIGAGAVGGFLAYNHKHLSDRYSFLGFLDDNKDFAGQLKFGYKIIGTVDQAKEYTDCVFLLGIAFPKIKEKIIQRLDYLNLEFINYISPQAYVSEGTDIGKGVIIYPNTFVDHHTKIGNYVTVNACCSVGHDCRLGNFVTLGPNVALAGYTKCLETSDIGIGAKTRQSIIIGKGAIVGGQAMVINNTPPNSVAIGVPAKIREEKKGHK